MAVSFDLSGKVAIVTGGGSGFGEDIARWLAEAGAAVMIADLNPGNSGRVVQAIREAGGTADSARCDVGVAEDVDRMVETTVAGFGRIDIVVNNAGYAQTYGSLMDVSADEFDNIFRVNVKSIFHTAKACIPHFRSIGSGLFINIASTAGLRPRPNLTWYNASKGAVITLTKSMAVELAPEAIRVNALCPGASDTPLYRTKFFAGQDLDRVGAMLRATIPLGRLVEPGDIGPAAVYLASDAAAYLTGVCLEIDGGRAV